jgi:WD40 repeat protein
MAERTEQLQSILVSYIEASEAGQAPARAELLARHPEFAAELAEFLDARERIQRLASQPPTLAPGETAPAGPLGKVPYFGDYELLEEIARGGMGVVFKARQVSLDRIVALKMILSGQLAGEADVRRFHQEANAAANLDHPNIVPIYEVGQHEGQHYFSMKLIEGGSLATLRRSVPESGTLLRSVAKLMATVARAVHHAHQRGILHRDLKPGNILLDAQGQPHVTDFGLAKRLQGDGKLTQSGAIVGTPSYMAPEQASGTTALTTAADVYGLGAILYELLTGQPPFRAATPMETLLQLVDREPVSPRQINPKIDRDLETVCLKCLEKDPSRRYESAAALADDLDRWLAGEPVVARPTPALLRVWKWAKRRPALAALLLTVVAAIAAVLVVGVIYDRQLQHALEDVTAEKALVAEVRTEAGELREQARRERDHILYMRDVDAAQRELLAAYPERCVAFLDLHHTYPRRGWEWHYLKRQGHRELLTVAGARAVAWSPDGRLLATAAPGAQFAGQAYDPNGWADVHLLDAGTGALVRTLHDAKETISALAFSGDGSRLAVLHVNDVVQVWDTGAGRLLNSWQDEAGPVGGRLAFRPDGKQAATICFEDVKVWDVETGEEVHRLRYRPEGESSNRSMQCLAYSPDGKLLAAGTSYRSVVLWDAATGKEVRIITGHDSSVSDVAFSPNGWTLLAASNDSVARLWEVESGRLMRTMPGHADGVSAVAFSPDGSRAATAGWDRRVRIWETGRWQPIGSWWDHNRGVFSLAFSPDGRRLASVDHSGPIRVWDARNLAETWPASFTEGGLCDLALSPDGTRLALARVSNSIQTDETGKWQTGEVEVCDAASGRVVRRVEQGRQRYDEGKTSWLLRLAFSPDGKRLAVVNVLERRTGITGVNAVAEPATVRVWDLADGRLLLTLEKAGEQVVFSPDGRWLATLVQTRPGQEWSGGSVRLWDARTGEPAGTFRQSGGRAVALAFSPDGRRLALAGARIAVLDVIDGELRPVLAFHQEARCLVFSPDGRHLATSSHPGVVHLWDVSAGKLVRELRQQRRNSYGGEGGWSLLYHSPRDLAFSPDGRRLAYATDHRTVRLHDVEGGQDLLVLDDFPFQVDRLFFDRDGRKLFAVDSYPRWHVWDATPLPDEIAFARLAQARVSALAAEVLPRSEIVERLREDATLSDAARAAALKLAETVDDRADRFDEAAWPVVLLPGAAVADYEKALHHAELACKLEPDSVNHENTLAAALYRVGRYTEALAALRRCVALHAARKEQPHYADRAFLAMTCHRLRQAEEAREHLEHLRRLKRETPEREQEYDFLTLLREAERVIAGESEPRR